LKLEWGQEARQCKRRAGRIGERVVGGGRRNWGEKDGGKDHN